MGVSSSYWSLGFFGDCAVLYITSKTVLQMENQASLNKKYILT
jgi:hypothetical protein